MLKSEIVWRPIATAPMGERIFVADLIDRVRHIGIGEWDFEGRAVFVCPGIPATPAGHWTHWAPLPDLPPWTDAAPLPANDAPRDLAADGLLKLVDKLERAHQTQAAIAWQHYQRAQAADLRVDALETAVADVLRYVSRGDWNNLRPETRAALEGKKS